ncbi:MAG: DUF3014 domain-containing protein [Acidobacteriota bacterium]
MEWDDPKDENEPTLDDAPLDGSPPEPEPSLDHGPSADDSEPAQRSDGPSGLAILLLILVAAVLGIGTWWYLDQRTTEPTPSEPPAASSDPSPVPDASSEVEVEEQLDLPPLSASDAFIREVVGRLADSPRLVEWLANEDLVRRFAAAVDTVARGETPRTHVGFLRPEEPFEVEQLPDGRWVIAEPTFTRWDPVFAVLDAVDPADTAKLYRQLEPLFEEAYAEIGRPGTTFRQRMNEAIARIQAVEYPEGPLIVTQRDGNWVYVDEELENASGLEKQLWRLGEEQGKTLSRSPGVQ